MTFTLKQKFALTALIFVAAASVNLYDMYGKQDAPEAVHVQQMTTLTSLQGNDFFPQMSRQQALNDDTKYILRMMCDSKWETQSLSDKCYWTAVSDH